MIQKNKTGLLAYLGWTLSLALSTVVTSAFAADANSCENESSVTLSTNAAEYIFTGEQIKPKVYCNGESLGDCNGENYPCIVSYGKNINSGEGEGSVSVKLTNGDDIEKKFTIEKRPITINVGNAEMELYGAQPNYTYKVSGTDDLNSDTLSNFINKLSGDGNGCSVENNEYQCGSNSGASLNLSADVNSSTKVGDELAIANSNDLTDAFLNYNIEVIPGTLTITMPPPVEYIDENGQKMSTTEYTLLTSDFEPDESGNIELPGGWYVVENSNPDGVDVNFQNMILFDNDVHLILADRAEMIVSTSDNWGIKALENFTVYGQSAGSGKLEAHSKLSAITIGKDFAVIGGNIEATGDEDSDISGENISISGGSVTAKGKSCISASENISIYGGIVTANGEKGLLSTNIAISGGSVTANGENGLMSKNITISGGSVTANGEYGISASENVTISGGSVTANGSRGIIADGVLTLGWTAETDRITAGSYGAGQGIIISEGKKFQDGTGKIYSGTIDREQAKALAGQTLTPFTGLIVTFDSDIHTETTNISLAHQIIVVDENGHVAAPEDPTYDGYKFLGWYTKDGNTKFDFDATITTDMTAYAKWEVAKYTITVVGEYLTVDKTEAAEGETVTLTVDYDGDYIIMIGAEGMEFNLDDYAQVFNVQKSGNSISFDMPTADITLRLEKSNAVFAENIPYIDENGKTKICEKAEVIQSDYVISRGGWYVVEGDVTANLIMLVNKQEGVHIILKDNAKLTLAGVEEDGEVMSAYIVGGLSIYAQSTGDNVGSFIAEGGVVARNLIVNGGSIQAKATLVDVKEVTSLTAFTFTMNGGSVNANDAYIEQLTMNGGSLKVLDYTNSFDIAAGTYIADEDGIVYSGSLDDKQIAAIEGKTLTPIVPKSLSDKSIVVADILAQDYDNGNPVCPSVVVTDGKNTLKAGTDYSVECFNNTGITSASLDEAAYVKISGMNRYKDDIEKRFFIWNNIGDYAAVRVFEDADGKTHAEINGEYDGKGEVSISSPIAVDAIDYVRAFDKETPATVMLPFSLPDCATVNARFYKLTNVEVVNNSWKATMTNIQNLDEKLPQANTPYAVILPENGQLKFDFESCGTDKAELQTAEVVTSSNKDETWTFTGTYSYKQWLSDNENSGEIGLVYAFSGSNDGGIAKGTFGRVASGGKANPMRAYLRKRDQFVTINNPLGIPPSNPSTPNGASLVARYSINMLPETVDVNFVDDVNYADIENGNRGEKTTAVGRAVPAADKIRVIRNRGTFDLKGRRVNESRKAKGAYYKR